jgi:hypothetical protein
VKVDALEVLRPANGESLGNTDIKQRRVQPRDAIGPHAYRTQLGAMYEGNSAELMGRMRQASVNLVATSPPYALHFKKEYGNVQKKDYVDWFRAEPRDRSADQHIDHRVADPH